MKITSACKLFLFTILYSLSSYAQPNWSQGVEVHSPRQNIYQLAPAEFNAKVEYGKKQALFYPVTVSDLLIPYRPLKAFFESDTQDPVRLVLYKLAKVVSPFKSMEEVFNWLGVHEFPPAVQAETPNALPTLSARETELPMGATIIKTNEGEALTFGCAACHAADLFGVKVLGLTNRFPRANEFFRHGQTYAPYINSFIFKDLLKTTEGERLLMLKAKNATKWVGTKKPAVLGLDTSLAQVALSLSKREKDPYATRTELSHLFPRPNKLSTMVSDSKPAVWWNVKYKNRWLSDGSIVSGNPVHTNFLWNEIGRGTDLKKLESWMSNSQKEIEALTAAVFASESPRYEKFFGIDSIDIEKARRGQKHYVESCQKCHGVYEKGWDQSNANQLSKVKLIQNWKVTYHAQTPVKDVGTDPGRYLGMKEFAADLNRLQISKNLNAVVEPQKGYVPPPLDGIWARWPYFHNNSIPNLCSLLTPSSQRPKVYFAGEAIDKRLDFDQQCVGYPTGEKTPASWQQNKEYLYDTTKEGLSNAGHDERIFLKDGKEIYSWEQKLELIEFLKTL
jgi:mono/diheme cytochrome c family protein